MNRFNLTFRGEILPGHDPERVKSRLGVLLDISDPEKLQQCFSGDPVVLSRNLERKDAADLYAKLRRIGIVAELVVLDERAAMRSHKQASPKPTPTAAPSPDSTPGPARNKRPADNDEAPLETAAKPQAEAAIEPHPRKADLAADHSLQEQDAAQLKAKERTLQRALRAKEKQQARRNRASKRAQKKALEREATHKSRIEAARKKAEQAEQKRKAEAEAAERKAEQARLKAEQAAQRQAERERAEAAELALKEAEKAAQEAYRERAKAAELARQEAERERRKAQRAAQEAEREQQAEQERLRKAELQREAQEKAARRTEEKRRKEQEADKARVEAARRKREQAAETAQRKVAELFKSAQEQAQKEAAEAERIAELKAMEEQAVERAAVELAHQPSLKSAAGGVKTRVELPSHKRGSATDPGRRKRQAGEPNLYSLRPFRNTPEVRARAEQSRSRMRQAFAAAAIALACGLLMLSQLAGLPTEQLTRGASALAIAPQQGPVLLAGEQLLLHDRAGVGVTRLPLAELGLASLQGPLVFDRDGLMLAPGRLAHSEQVNRGTTPTLLRCKLAEPACVIFSEALAGTTIDGIAVHPLDGTVFIADASSGELLKLSPGGELLARATATVAARPILRLDSGLLLINSDQGPAISVFRYEDDAFGQQLDEILVLPPQGPDIEYTGTRDFLYNGEYWWVSLYHRDTNRAELYRFDRQWQFIEQVALAAGSKPEQLTAWGNRVLLSDPDAIPVQRFSALGTAEAPFVSELLRELVDGQQRAAAATKLGWRIALAISLLALLGGCVVGATCRMRSLVYTSSREHGAEPVDKVIDDITWTEHHGERLSRFGRTAKAYAVLVLGFTLGAIGMGVSALQLSALLLLLAGPAVALLLLHRAQPGHIGTTGEQLLLVDHYGMYHLGGGGCIHYRGPFLMIDDVVVFTGTHLLPAFAPDQLAQGVMPLAQHGIKVDRKIVTTRLLQGRHPLALGALAILGCAVGAIALLSLQCIL